MVENYLEINHQRGKVQQKLGELLYDSTERSQEALECFQNAVKFSEKALEIISGEKAFKNNSNKNSILLILGDSLHKIGSLEIKHFLEKNGLNSFEAKIDSYSQVESKLKNEKFIQNFEKAIKIYDQVLKESPDNTFAHSGKGRTLLGFGEFYTNQGLTEEAIEKLREAIVCFDQALKLANEKTLLKVFIFIDKGFVFQKIGECQIKQNLEKKAIDSFAEGIKSLGEALNFQPNNFLANLNKGRLLYEQGFLQAKLGFIEDAQINLTQSVKSSEQAINVISADKFAYTNMGSALQELSRLNRQNGEESKAQESLEEAIASYNKALELDPKDSFANLNKGSALLDLGRLKVKNQLQEALVIFSQSITSSKMSLNIIPDNIDVLNNKSAALCSCGWIQLKINLEADALISLEEALVVSNQTISLSANNIVAYLNKGNAEQILGELFTNQGKFETALENYSLSLKSYEKAHGLTDVYVNRGLSLQHSGDLFIKLNERQKGCENYRLAEKEYDKALEVNSKDENCLRQVESLNNKIEKYCK